MTKYTIEMTRDVLHPGRWLGKVVKKQDKRKSPTQPAFEADTLKEMLTAVASRIEALWGDK